MFSPLFRRLARTANVDSLYGMIVAQARSPVFYGRLGVPDSVDGRFDILVLHLVLVVRRLARDPGAAGVNEQDIFDRFCRDMDDNLREMGVGDLAVPREMRRMAGAFYGRQATYQAALEATDEGELENAIARNIYSGAAADARHLKDFVAYVRAVVSLLDGCDSAALANAQFVFPDPEPDAANRAKIDP
jgi:cytochrome b pre-mRNA-processing protein 3